MTALHRAARLLGLVPSRHYAGSYTGWSSLARLVPTPAAVDFAGRLRTPLAISPMASPGYDTNPLERAS